MKGCSVKKIMILLQALWHQELTFLLHVTCPLHAGKGAVSVVVREALADGGDLTSNESILSTKEMKPWRLSHRQ
jgi:hypothetical protein